MVKTVSEASVPESMPYNNFRLRIFGMNRSHVVMTLLGSKTVRHGIIYILSRMLANLSG